MMGVLEAPRLSPTPQLGSLTGPGLARSPPRHAGRRRGAHGRAAGDPVLPQPAAGGLGLLPPADTHPGDAGEGLPGVGASCAAGASTGRTPRASGRSRGQPRWAGLRVLRRSGGGVPWSRRRLSKAFEGFKGRTSCRGRRPVPSFVAGRGARWGSSVDNSPAVHRKVKCRTATCAAPRETETLVCTVLTAGFTTARCPSADEWTHVCPSTRGVPLGHEKEGGANTRHDVDEP